MFAAGGGWALICSAVHDTAARSDVMLTTVITRDGSTIICATEPESAIILCSRLRSQIQTIEVNVRQVVKE